MKLFAIKFSVYLAWGGSGIANDGQWFSGRWWVMTGLIFAGFALMGWRDRIIVRSL